MNSQIEQFVRNIRERMPTHASPQAAADRIRSDFEAIAGGPFPPLAEENLVAALAIVIAGMGKVEILRRLSIVKAHDDWYDGPQDSDLHWPALRGFLENEKGWNKDTLASINSSSTEVVSLLANPNKAQFRCRGLVVGYVQSGKTANMTAVIAKALDAGYNLIVVLAGTTNKLRWQTQGRLEYDIVNRHRSLWQLYTTNDDNGDFVLPPNKSFTMPVAGRPQLVVMKKVTSRLKAFLKTVRESPTVLRALKVLIIDDECDQASVNAASDEFSMTKINEKIREIIEALPAASYVGYTATPFANVFINPFPHNRDTLDDLYPEDFITALPRPEGYFGTREVFGLPPVDAGGETDQEAGLDMIRDVPAVSLPLLRPAKLRDRTRFTPQLTKDLKDAVLWFLISCAVRRRRGQDDQHMTMLIHTSPYVIQHERMAELVQSWIRDEKRNLKAGKGVDFARMEELWEEELARVPLKDSWPVPGGPRDLLPELGEVLQDLEYAIENGDSFTRLDYTGPARIYVVVGGSVLARGLTLEGLSVSFFLRTAKQYDTLLQMGRWFGYRGGYEDLPRLWTTPDLASDFRALAQIEDEIREEIAAYRQNNATPLEFAVKVRAIPGMAITSANKMRHAHRTNISFEGRHIQTIRFDHRNADIVAANWTAAGRMATDISSQIAPGLRPGQVLARDVEYSVVRRFLAEYSICTAHMDLKKELLLDYTDKSSDHLRFWDIGFVVPAGGPVSEKPLGGLGRIGTNERSKLRSGSRSFADIKALMSKKDILIDAPDYVPADGDGWEEFKAARPDVPLLLVYPISAASAARRMSREDLNAVGDLVGIGVVFPGSKDRSGNYFAVELEIPATEQVDEEDPEVELPAENGND